jgi:hypothetical protein
MIEDEYSRNNDMNETKASITESIKVEVGEKTEINKLIEEYENINVDYLEDNKE